MRRRTDRTSVRPVLGALVVATAALLSVPPPAGAVAGASRPDTAVPVATCPESGPPVHGGAVVDVRDGRPALVTTWLPSHVAAANADRLAPLVRQADRSTVSTRPESSMARGHISTGLRPAIHRRRGYGDHVVLTRNLLLWFDFTAERTLRSRVNVTPNGGGGQLRGVLPLTVDGDGVLRLRDERRRGWAPNHLLAGGDGRGVRGSGLSGSITEHVEDNGVTYNVENDTASHLAASAPLDERWILVQAVGSFVDTRRGGDRYVIGSGATTGGIRSTTSYRIPACDDGVVVETSWTNPGPNRIGPVANIVNAVNLYGDRVGDRAGANVLSLGSTSDGTCVTRFGVADTHTCHSGPEDYRSVGAAHGYRSQVSVVTPPPTMTLHARRSDGLAVDPSLELLPLSGAVSTAVVFNTHSTAHLIPAFDITYFNRTFWEDVDPRYAAADATALPVGIERLDGRYFISPAATLTTRFALRFS